MGTIYLFTMLPQTSSWGVEIRGTTSGLSVFPRMIKSWCEMMGASRTASWPAGWIPRPSLSWIIYSWDLSWILPRV